MQWGIFIWLVESLLGETSKRFSSQKCAIMLIITFNSVSVFIDLCKNWSIRDYKKSVRLRTFKSFPVRNATFSRKSSAELQVGMW